MGDVRAAVCHASERTGATENKAGHGRTDGYAVGRLCNFAHCLSSGCRRHTYIRSAENKVVPFSSISLHFVPFSTDISTSQRERGCMRVRSGATASHSISRWGVPYIHPFTPLFRFTFHSTLDLLIHVARIVVFYL